MTTYNQREDWFLLAHGCRAAWFRAVGTVTAVVVHWKHRVTRTAPLPFKFHMYCFYHLQATS